ncbi:PIG-L family deacetylase [Saccharothrix variisporea]|uniref:GlcNAc-PI de-N-acetylase n=1 Tax=Saccharothrix variisporea TaxID=543527 RepID=A0A495X9B2_9PSEU|nr:PIG-L family deacetylase [Saccharothrix variisporea]RKT68128.1 GlcNAc-PI de-N-acetylase [Saccharothrix variisporea]
MARARPVVALAALVLGLVIACGGPAPDPAGASDVAYLQVVAHHDDDLLFMNPDVREAVRSGRRVETVFLTAGEAEVPDANGYSASRQAGARAAYARMAGVPDEWDGTAADLAGGRVGERYTLKAKPQVTLVFLNLPEDGDPRADGGRGALRRLWKDRAGGVVSVDTLTPTGGKMPGPSTYTGNGLIRVLVELMDDFRPTVLRVQDSDPDPDYPQWKPWHDHPDHVVGARFTEEAARVYQRSPEHPRLVVVGYRDYNTDASPVNLPPARQEEKIGDFAAYQAHDRNATGHPSYDAWPRRMYYRWDRGTQWVVRTDDGLRAYAPQGKRLLGWRRHGDRWERLDDLGGPGGKLAFGLSATRGKNGPTVCGRLLDSHDITCRDDRGWASLGSPDPGDVRVGTPTAAAYADGRVAVFVRDAGGGVSRSEQDRSGVWGPWTRLGRPGATPITDGLTAVTGPSGTPEVLGSTRDAPVHWSGAWNPSDGPWPAPAGPPSAVYGKDDTLTVVYPVADTGELATTTRTNGKWTPPTRSPGPDGPGRPATVYAHDRVMVVGRDKDGGVSVDGTSAGGDPLDYPTAAVDGNGRVVLLAIGADGRLHTSSEQDGGRFAPWQAAG